jgi:hypothetical protein
MLEQPELGENAQEKNGVIDSPAMLPLLQVFCCCLPLSAALPGLSRRTRLLIVAGWALVLAAGWAASAITT